MAAQNRAELPAMLWHGTDPLRRESLPRILSSPHESPEVKKVAKLPATTVTTKMPHNSRPTSIILPTEVSGFFMLDETVSNCTEQKKAASPIPWISPPFFPLSKIHMSTVPAAKTTIDSPPAISRRASSRRCRSARVKSLDNSSRITAEPPSPCSAVRGCAAPAPRRQWGHQRFADRGHFASWNCTVPVDACRQLGGRRSRNAYGRSGVPLPCRARSAGRRVVTGTGRSGRERIQAPARAAYFPLRDGCPQGGREPSRAPQAGVHQPG